MTVLSTVFSTVFLASLEHLFFGAGRAAADSMLAAGGGYTRTTSQVKGICP
jgi:hypothetical protein